MKYRNILLFVFFILLGFVFEKSNIWIISNDIDTKYFTEKLFEKEKKVDELIDSLFICAKNHKLSKWVNENSTDIDLLLKSDGIALFVYSNLEMIYWTTNSVAVPDNSSWFNNKFAEFGNSFLEIRKKQNDTLTIVGVITVMNNYPYENKFLRNIFHQSFSLDGSHKLTINEENKENSIYNYEGDYLFSLNKELKDNSLLIGRIMVAFLLIALFFLMLFVYSKTKHKKVSIRRFIILSSVLIVLRIIFQVYNIPSFVNQLPIFQSQYFTFSLFFPSLGDLLITVTLTIYLIFIFYVKVEIGRIKKYSFKKTYSILLLWLSIFILYGIIAQNIFTHLITDSNFEYEAYDVLSLTVFSFIGYFILLLLLIGLILLIDKACLQIKGHIKLRSIIIGIVISAIVLIIINIFLQNYNSLLPIAFIFLVIVYWVFVRLYYSPSFVTVVIFIALFSAYATYFIRKENFKKRIDNSKDIAVSIANEQDPIAEVIIGDVINQVKSDSVIVNYLNNDWFNYNEMVNYIQQEYFTGYMNRYIFHLTVCSDTDSVLVDENEQRMEYCYGFFEDLLETDGKPTIISGLYYLKNLSGGLNYFVRIEIPYFDKLPGITLFFELTERPNFEVLGYPELLLKEPKGLNETYNTKNYAKYNRNQLIVSDGEFPYALERDVYGFLDNEYDFFQSENFDHIVYNSNADQSVIISFPTINFYNILISFTYIFFFLLIQITILLLIGNRFVHLISFNFNIKNKIVLSMLLILLISLVFVGGGAMFYAKKQFEKEQIDILNEKIKSVIVELEHKLSEFDDIHKIDPTYVNSLLVKFSNVFFTDINLYDLDGVLVGTSRKEIFERNLTGRNINAIAYRELVLNKKARVIHKEFIGSMEYYSAYIPFINGNNELLAYLNLPYFSKEIILRKELLRVIVAVINIFAFILILSIAVAIFISNRLTEPLRMVQQRIRDIDLSKNNERIDYHGRDEIADLVTEYNRMLEELDNSARLLAKSERETAWREMARQIAHEIKNPLTPMKLSIQLLDKSWKNKDDDFDKRFNRSTKTLIEQIDSLSSIASAFSQFARMPIARSEKVNIIERIKRSAQLFKECSYLTLNMKLPKNQDIYVRADNERMLQVFNNLVKNAIQSIPKDKNGEVNISLALSDESVVVEIKDNGTGILPEMEDKLFQPNFTTKSSGTGLGLAIVKNIIEEFGGAIWHDSTLGEGTSFFISLPIYIEE